MTLIGFINQAIELENVNYTTFGKPIMNPYFR